MKSSLKRDVLMGKYKKPKWAVKQLVRESGLVEDIDEYGCGHPNLEWLKEHDPDGKKGFGIHGCNGSCHREGYTEHITLEEFAKMIGIHLPQKPKRVKKGKRKTK
jgi:hypothetical protein